jgi:hypothetical protein
LEVFPLLTRFEARFYPGALGQNPWQRRCYHDVPPGEWRNLADAQDSGSCEGNLVGVQLPPRPPVQTTLSVALALIIRAMDERSGETARQQVPSTAAPGEAVNPPAQTSLVLGIAAFVIPLLTLGLLVLEAIESEASSGAAGAVTIASLIALPLAIAAIVSGVRGRSLARAGGPGRSPATVGLVLGIVVVATPIAVLLAFITWMNCCAPASF